MSFKILFTEEAVSNLIDLEHNPNKRKQYKAVLKCVGYLESDPKHPSLSTHEYNSLTRQFGVKIFEAYAENKTPQAYRVFWHYGPDKSEITIIAITAHS